jgi:hypothetical protein
MNVLIVLLSVVVIWARTRWLPLMNTFFLFMLCYYVLSVTQTSRFRFGHIFTNYELSIQYENP